MVVYPGFCPDSVVGVQKSEKRLFVEGVEKNGINEVGLLWAWSALVFRQLPYRYLLTCFMRFS